MHSTFLTRTLGLLVIISAAAAAPSQLRNREDDVDAARRDASSADDQPLILLQIHPSNRTDLCLGLLSPLPAINSTLSLVSCNYTSPNNESSSYSSWTLNRDDDDDDDEKTNPAYGFEVRLNGTDLCLDNDISAPAAKLSTCRDRALTLQWLYSDNLQLNIPQTFSCLGKDENNFPQVQDCVPDELDQTWTFQAFPMLR